MTHCDYIGPLFHDGLNGVHICPHCGEVVRNYTNDVRCIHRCYRDPKLDYSSLEAYKNSKRKMQW